MPKKAARKPIQDLIEELRSWLPNYDHGPEDFPTILYRLLAGVPGGDQLEDMGYVPFGNLGWKEVELLGEVLEAIQNKRDVEELVDGLTADDVDGLTADDIWIGSGRDAGPYEVHPDQDDWVVINSDSGIERFRTQDRDEAIGHAKDLNRNKRRR